MNGLRMYTQHVDSLIINVLVPEMQRLKVITRRAFWERGCIDGRHCTLYFEPAEDYSWEGIAETLYPEIAAFLATHPSSESESPQSARATARLLWQEGRLPQSDSGRKRDSVQRCTRSLELVEQLSSGLEKYLYLFLQLTGSVLEQAIANKLNKIRVAAMLVTTYVETCYVAPELGCISLYGHWANYEQWFKPVALLDLARERIDHERGQIEAEVTAALSSVYDNGVWRDLREQWRGILRQMMKEAALGLADGSLRFPQPTSDNLQVTLSSLTGSTLESAEFLRLLYSNSHYMGVDAPNLALWRTRLLVNCVYSTFANIGLSVVDRMVVSSCVREIIVGTAGVSYIDLLKERMARYDATNA